MSSQYILILQFFFGQFLSFAFNIFSFSLYNVPVWLLFLPSFLLLLPSLLLLCPFKFTCVVDLSCAIIFCHFITSSDSCSFSHCSPLSFHPKSNSDAVLLILDPFSTPLLSSFFLVLLLSWSSLAFSHVHVCVCVKCVYYMPSRYMVNKHSIYSIYVYSTI